jgi:membrane protease YdiL (CAAX protease family)
VDRGAHEKRAQASVILPRRKHRSAVPVPAEIVGAVTILAHNFVLHRILRPPADSALNLASAGILTAFAIRIGCTPAELGLDRADLGRGLRTGSLGAAACSAAVGMVAVLPATRSFFRDARLTDMSRKEALYHASLRIPVATAGAEEIIFRSALHALFARKHSLRATVPWTSLVFGLWHILPTLDAFEENPVSDLVQNQSRARLMAALGITVATAGAGVFFSYLRLRSRSVVAPVLAHAAINLAGLVIGKALTSPSARRG